MSTTNKSRKSRKSKTLPLCYLCRYNTDVLPEFSPLCISCWGNVKSGIIFVNDGQTTRPVTLDHFKGIEPLTITRKELKEAADKDDRETLITLTRSRKEWKRLGVL